MTISDRVRIKDVRVLSNGWTTLKTTTFEYRRASGEWQTQKRETYERDNAAAVLPYNLARRTVILVKQFRLPAFIRGYDDLLIEAAAGVLDNAEPEERIRAEAEEETGYRLHHVHKVFEAFMSPGAITEKLHFFVAEYEPEMRVGDGGGLEHEGEDIEVLELSIDEALAMINDGRIIDAKAIMLLQYAALHVFR
ncbi:MULTISPECIES: NUDIX domain-containing protein [unclassified Bradyrhizobium]|uniref:NUDIX domain-containing protein n=1 Tax=unclassified Bradyrhizobium TaxID=2631580 RepID=UPI00211E7C91|nr:MULTISPECIES: NUDIX domain-containing protein [unclassified Bradyrhizobium]MDD1536127.1 GDP-mannose pyrophosphatase [Bradyrhizobium sp. WBOS8]MDD1585887.1 GDP-mannose pyrophosphatase [Bradyrhizobium sp. WBOS4]UUO47673.1 GDP-mannose pyrophosphatase [Bradyrhizobium sp. WBOS04]UUO61290.1 GDP-mannose pyrophosphatase [Bradyrhizobium sp. WBOS08]